MCQCGVLLPRELVTVKRVHECDKRAVTYHVHCDNSEPARTIIVFYPSRVPTFQYSAVSRSTTDKEKIEALGRIGHPR